MLERKFILHPCILCLCSCGENGVSEAAEAAFLDGVSAFAPFFWITALPEGECAARLCSVPVAEICVLTPGAVKDALELASMRGGRTSVSVGGHTNESSTQALIGLGEFVPTFYTADDLITTRASRGLMELAVAHILHRGTVREDWGMDSKNAYGRGVCVLFYGPPGTGKTMAAQVMAREVGMRLFRVDSSQLTSKYIGETSKNISRLFDEARGGDYVLFFDEADAIFGERTSVNDASGRYANSGTSFLLQKIEEYDGMVMLATNLLNNIDDAFRRRVTYMGDFSLPDRELREKILRSMFPDTLSLGEVDSEYLSGFDLPDSGMKSVVTSAADMAVMENSKVGMSQLVRALQIFFRKTGRRLLRSDLAPYDEYFDAWPCQKARPLDTMAARGPLNTGI